MLRTSPVPTLGMEAGDGVRLSPPAAAKDDALAAKDIAADLAAAAPSAARKLKVKAPRIAWEVEAWETILTLLTVKNLHLHCVEQAQLKGFQPGTRKAAWNLLGRGVLSGMRLTVRNYYDDGGEKMAKFVRNLKLQVGKIRERYRVVKGEERSGQVDADMDKIWPLYSRAREVFTSGSASMSLSQIPNQYSDPMMEKLKTINAEANASLGRCSPLGELDTDQGSDSDSLELSESTNSKRIKSVTKKAGRLRGYRARSTLANTKEKAFKAIIAQSSSSSGGMDALAAVLREQSEARRVAEDERRYHRAKMEQRQAKIEQRRAKVEQRRAKVEQRQEQERREQSDRQSRLMMAMMSSMMPGVNKDLMRLLAGPSVVASRDNDNDDDSDEVSDEDSNVHEIVAIDDEDDEDED